MLRLSETGAHLLAQLLQAVRLLIVLAPQRLRAALRLVSGALLCQRLLGSQVGIPSSLPGLLCQALSL